MVPVVEVAAVEAAGVTSEQLARQFARLGAWFGASRPATEMLADYEAMIRQEGWEPEGLEAAVTAAIRREEFYPRPARLRWHYCEWEVEAVPRTPALPEPPDPTARLRFRAAFRAVWTHLLLWAVALRFAEWQDRTRERTARYTRPMGPETEAAWRELGHRLGRYQQV